MIYDKRDIGTFIPSFLDDYGLHCDEFRIYARIARRAGSGKCFESIKNIAIACFISEARAREIIHLLAIARMIAILPRVGKTSEYALTGHDDWIEPIQLEAARAEAFSLRKRIKKSREKTPPVSETTTARNTPCFSTPPARNNQGGVSETQTPLVSETQTPLVSETHEKGASAYTESGIQRSEGIPLRYSIEGNPLKEEERAQKPDRQIQEPIAPTDPDTESSSVNEKASASDRQLGGSRAAAPPPFVPPLPPSSAQRCDRLFQSLPWGSYQQPEQGFLEWLIKHHLPYVSGYKERPTLTIAHGREWLNKAKFQEERYEQATLKYQEYAEWRDRPAITPVAASEPEPWVRPTPNLEAVRNARKLAGLPERRYNHAG